MLEKIQSFIDRYIKRISAMFIIAVILLWIIARFIPALSTWIIDQNLFTVVVAVLLVDVINRLVDLKQFEKAKREGIVLSNCRDEGKIIEVIKSAQDELLIMGGNLFIILYHTVSYSDLFKRITRVRILILNGHSEAARMREKSIIDEKNYAQLHEGTLTSLRDIATKLGESAKNIELRVYDLPAMHFLCIADWRRMILNNYSYGLIGVDSPHFYFDHCETDKNQIVIMKHYRDAFEFVWERAEPKPII